MARQAGSRVLPGRAVCLAGDPRRRHVRPGAMAAPVLMIGSPLRPVGKAGHFRVRALIKCSSTQFANLCHTCGLTFCGGVIGGHGFFTGCCGCRSGIPGCATRRTGAGGYGFCRLRASCLRRRTGTNGSCVPGEIADTCEGYQQKPPDDPLAPAPLILLVRRRKLISVQRTGKAVPIRTIRPQRVIFGCPPEKIVYVAAIVFHK